MTDAAFIRAIIAEPADDLPRLVLADWLDEHGEPDRAEFIRVQCDLATLPDSPLEAASYRGERAILAPAVYAAARSILDPHAGRRAALRRRERELMEAPVTAASVTRERWIEWAKSMGGAGYCLNIYDGTPLSPPNRAIRFTRGFVSSVVISWADFQTHAAALLAACPIRRVNRPRACGACGGRPLQLPGATADLPCLKCRGTGRMDDWRGDGTVWLTTWPDDATVARKMNQRAGRDTGWEHSDYPGVWFEMPAAAGDIVFDGAGNPAGVALGDGAVAVRGVIRVPLTTGGRP